MCFSGYVCYRKDRNRNGGGCVVFVKDKWFSKWRKDLESEFFEMVCVEICLDKVRNIIFVVMYKLLFMNSENFFLSFK